jgi:hypothetical protein
LAALWFMGTMKQGGAGLAMVVSSADQSIPDLAAVGEVHAVVLGAAGYFWGIAILAKIARIAHATFWVKRKATVCLSGVGAGDQQGQRAVRGMADCDGVGKRQGEFRG